MNFSHWNLMKKFCFFPSIYFQHIGFDGRDPHKLIIPHPLYAASYLDKHFTFLVVG
jgi:hypothetical protein